MARIFRAGDGDSVWIINLNQTVDQNYVMEAPAIGTWTKSIQTHTFDVFSELADKRARLLQRFLRRLASHPRILLDCDFRDFLCFEGILPKSDFTSILSGSNMKKMFKTMGELFSKFAFPMDENDRWFEQVHSQIDELDVSILSPQLLHISFYI